MTMADVAVTDFAASRAAERMAGARAIPESERARFATLNAADFGFRHGLGDHPLFTLPNLLALAQRINRHPGFVYWQNGARAVTDGWRTDPAKQRTLAQSIEGIAENDTVVIIKHAEQDETFGPVLRQALRDVYDYAPKGVQDDIILGESLIFINSPNRKTAYHLDLEISLLLQVTGEKTAFVWKSRDPAVTADVELERHCAGDHSAAVYKPERQSDANAYPLRAGDGVHFPNMAPHWVQNGQGVSISVNLNYDTRSVHHRLKHVYAVNHSLRRAGFAPSRPGERPWLDAVKSGARESLEVVLSQARKLAGRRPYPQWKPR